MVASLILFKVKLWKSKAHNLRCGFIREEVHVSLQQIHPIPKPTNKTRKVMVLRNL